MWVVNTVIRETQTKCSWLHNLTSGLGEEDGNVILAGVLLQCGITTLLVSGLPTPLVGVQTKATLAVQGEGVQQHT